MSRARYDENFRQQAIALAVEIGPADAARQLGVKAATLRSWCSRADVATNGTENTRAAVEAKRAKWEDRRADMVHQIGDTAQQALTRASQAIASGKPTDAKNYATTMAILVDKAQLLSGGHTARYGTDADRTRVLGEAHERGLSLVKSA